MGWAPSEFWRATFHDLTCVMWARKEASEPKKRELSSADVVSLFGARARKG